jgi:hypothetical protein
LTFDQDEAAQVKEKAKQRRNQYISSINAGILKPTDANLKEYNIIFNQKITKQGVVKVKAGAGW